MEPYTFEFEGVKVEYNRATVRTGLETARIRQKLIEALGYDTEMPTEEWENASTFSETMARSKADAPWWCKSNMSNEQIKAAYELFMEADEELYSEFNRAYRATLPPKKTIANSVET